MGFINMVSGTNNKIIVHPGEVLKEILFKKDVSTKELARLTGVTEYRVLLILNGKMDISDEFAVKLEKTLGIDAYYWMDLQANYERAILKSNDNFNKN